MDGGCVAIRLFQTFPDRIESRIEGGGCDLENMPTLTRIVRSSCGGECVAVPDRIESCIFLFQPNRKRFFHILYNEAELQGGDRPARELENEKEWYKKKS